MVHRLVEKLSLSNNKGESFPGLVSSGNEDVTVVDPLKE